MNRKLIYLAGLVLVLGLFASVQADVILHYDASKDTGDLDGDGNVEWEDVTEVGGTGANGNGTGLDNWDWDTSLMGNNDQGCSMFHLLQRLMPEWLSHRYLISRIGI